MYMCLQSIQNTKHESIRSISNYTTQTAPITMPINTLGYSAQKDLTGYTRVIDYIGVKKACEQLNVHYGTLSGSRKK
ncbi:hypothetical protein [Treponema sp.]|uniref:hypothetical protein n=1 Tax=Treponema sp. TaxID=166 RepID=UPI003FA2FB24